MTNQTLPTSLSHCIETVTLKRFVSCSTSDCVTVRRGGIYSSRVNTSIMDMRVGAISFLIMCDAFILLILG